MTTQWLGEGLTDFDPEVRQETAEALGQILSKKMGNFNDNILLNFLKQHHLNYPLPLAIATAYLLTPKDLYATLDILIASAVLFGLPLWPLFHLFSDPSQTRNIRFHISEKIYEAVYDPKPEVRKSAVQSIGQMKHVYPLLIDALIETLSFSSSDEVKKQALKSLRDSLENLYLGKWVYHLSGLRYEERKESNAINHVVKPLYGTYDKENDYRRVILDYLEKRKIKPEKYYSVQTNKAEELKREREGYNEKDTNGNSRKGSNNNEPPTFDSWFEVEVFLELHERGYIVLPQFPVPQENNSNPPYYIDLVILDSQNLQNRVAVECDGSYHDKSEKQKKDEDRQKKLEADGWTVWRISHSKEKTPSLPAPYFYSYYPTKNDYPNKKWKDREINEESLNKLWEKLDTMKIKPVKKKRGY